MPKFNTYALAPCKLIRGGSGDLEIPLLLMLFYLFRETEARIMWVFDSMESLSINNLPQEPAIPDEEFDDLVLQALGNGIGGWSNHENAPTLAHRIRRLVERKCKSDATLAGAKADLVGRAPDNNLFNLEPRGPTPTRHQCGDGW